ncbi:MAG: putative Glyoxalase [Pseudonocardiales bacterium]|nr:putative Glyoxalase [Pseudonocardiales bacterium]
MAYSIQGVHHVGITVRDVQRSLDWYATMFDLTRQAVNHGEGQDLSRSVQVPGAELSFSMMRVGGTRIEFLQYHEPVGADFDRGNNDVGSTHVCLEVSDIDAAYADLRGKGAIFSGPPVQITEGGLAGSRWAYLRDPDGIQLEIWESPGA